MKTNTKRHGWIFGTVIPIVAGKAAFLAVVCVFLVVAVSLNAWAKKVPDLIIIGIDSTITVGKIMSVEDKALIFSSITKSDSGQDPNSSEKCIFYTEISKIVIVKTGNFEKGLSYGLLIGGGFGGLLGLASGDDQEGFIRFSAPYKALRGGLLGGTLGLVIGGIVGAASDEDRVLLIDGRYDTFHSAAAELRKIFVRPNKRYYR